MKRHQNSFNETNITGIMEYLVFLTVGLCFVVNSAAAQNTGKGISLAEPVEQGEDFKVRR